MEVCVHTNLEKMVESMSEAELTRTLALVQKNLSIIQGMELNEHERGLLNSNKPFKRIDAIKALRLRTKCSLRRAADVVDRALMLWNMM